MFEDALASLRPRRRASIALSTGLHAFLCSALVLPPLMRMPDPGDPPEKMPPVVSLVEEAAQQQEKPKPEPPPVVPPGPHEQPQSNVSVVTVPTDIPNELPKPLKDGEKEAPEKLGTYNAKATSTNEGPPVVAPPPGTGEGEGPLQVSTPGVAAPIPLSTPSPDYPELMRRAGIEGVVILESVINREGRVTDVRVLRGVNPVLDRAATEAVMRWTYRPALVGEHPVAVYLTVTINFRLNR